MIEEYNRIELGRREREVNFTWCQGWLKMLFKIETMLNLEKGDRVIRHK